MKILFTKGYKVKAIDGDTFEAGQAVTMSDRSAQHFIDRGVAEVVQVAKVQARKKTESRPR